MATDWDDLPDDPEAAVRRFKRQMDARDLERARSRDEATQAYHALPGVTRGDIKFESAPFQNRPMEVKKMYVDVGNDRHFACSCTEAELFSIFKGHDSAQVIKVYEQFPTPLPDGCYRRRACLRFARVESGVVEPVLEATTELPSSTAQAAMLGLHVNGCYAVQFFGYRAKHYIQGTPSTWHGSTVDFIIYQLLCSD